MDETTKAELARLHDEEARQNRRLENLEKKVEGIEDINLSLKELTISTKTMCKELVKQGERLEKLEQKPAETMSTIAKTALTAIVSIFIGWIASGAYSAFIK